MATKRTKGSTAIKAVAMKLEHLTVTYKPIDWFKPNEYNPNRQSEHEFNLLLKSISDDGVTQPILCLPDGRIVDGEHRWRACQKLGYVEAPAVIVDMTEEQRRVATLRHNLARGSHDIELEAGVLRDLQNLGVMDWAQEALQLTDVEIDRMLNDVKPIEEFGQGEYSEAWDYEPNKEMQQAGSASSSAKQVADNARALQQAGMKAADVQLVNRGITMTKDQEKTYNKAMEGQSADAIIAFAEAHVAAKDRAGKGEWTSLTFLVPTAALVFIENELARITRLAPGIKRDLTPELIRGLALELMAQLSSQTPDESLQ